MLNKDRVAKKGKVNKKSSDNGGVVAAINAMRQEMDERLTDIEDKSASGKAKLLIASLAYDTPDERLPELTRIPLTLVDPLVTDTVLDALLDERVLSDEVSIGEVERNIYYKLMRSVGGEHLKKARETAEEEKTDEREAAADYNLGGD